MEINHNIEIQKEATAVWEFYKDWKPTEKTRRSDLESRDDAVLVRMKALIQEQLPEQHQVVHEKTEGIMGIEGMEKGLSRAEDRQIIALAASSASRRRREKREQGFDSEAPEAADSPETTSEGASETEAESLQYSTQRSTDIHKFDVAYKGIRSGLDSTKQIDMDEKQSSEAYIQLSRKIISEIEDEVAHRRKA